MAGIGVSGAVEEVQDLLVVQLCGRGQRWALGADWGPRAFLLRFADVDTRVLEAHLPARIPSGFWVP